MTDEEAIDDDEVEEPLEDEEEGDAIVGDGDDLGLAASSKASEVLEDFSIASRQRLRDELQDQIAAFLARGGQINEIPPNVTADPPKKPAPDYGGRPI